MSDKARPATVGPAFDECALAVYGDEAHAIRVGRFLLRHGAQLPGWPAQAVPDSRQDVSNS